MVLVKRINSMYPMDFLSKHVRNRSDAGNADVLIEHNNLMTLNPTGEAKLHYYARVKKDSSFRVNIYLYQSRISCDDWLRMLSNSVSEVLFSLSIDF